MVCQLDQQLPNIILHWWCLKSTNELLGHLNDLTLPTGYSMFSTDIESMYPSIAPKDAIECIINFIESNKIVFQNLPITNIKNLLTDCLIKSNSLQIDKKFFAQRSGLKQGSSLSGLLADVYIYVNYETKFVLKNPNIKLYKRYRDDCIVIGKSDYMDTFINNLNNVNENIRFTIESSENNTLNFLDKQIIIYPDSTIGSSWYKKATKGDKMLSFKAEVPYSWKKSALLGFLNRVVFSSFEKNNLNRDIMRMKRILVKNKYPFKLINDLISKKLPGILEKRDQYWGMIKQGVDHPKIPKPDQEGEKIYLKIPFYGSHMDKIIQKLKHEIYKIFPKMTIIIVSTSQKTFSIFKQLLVNKPDPLIKENTIYHFTCDCEQNYIGESSKILRTRIEQHYTSETSSINEHLLCCDIYNDNLKKSKNKKKCIKFESQ